MKKKIKENFRVSVYPKEYPTWNRSEKGLKNICEIIARQIRRHVDDIDYVEIVFDSKEVCEYCLCEWTVDSYTGCPVCCSKAEREWIEENE